MLTHLPSSVRPSAVLRAEADPSARSHLIYSLSRKDNPNLSLKDYATGCDADIGGKSTAVLDFDEHGDARFWGELRRDVKGEYKGKVRGGYAGFRNKRMTGNRGVEAAYRADG
ncbi:hypothetical protein QFC24_004953 [Naganishia onofrii]|uniref:Uncharacterized protein n=1 Tax=Naganishia onofrii TaxID=1851511 RepID=A0ACC2XAZ6_9TREE|nr:hypothetical protein QFC24_004953 [Naganishia onofrii]